MKKIKLVVEELRVQSYATTGGGRAKGGTVHGQEEATIIPECSGHVTCASACSATNGVVVCKTCGPCC